MAVSSLTCSFGKGSLTEKTARPRKGGHFLQAVVLCPFHGAPEYKKTFFSFLLFFKPCSFHPNHPRLLPRPPAPLFLPSRAGRCCLRLCLGIFHSWGAFRPNAVVSEQISQSPVTSLSVSVTFSFLPSQFSTRFASTLVRSLPKSLLEAWVLANLRGQN